MGELKMIKVKKIRENAIIPARQGDVQQSSCIDLTVAEVAINGKEVEHVTQFTKSEAPKKVVCFAKGDIVTLYTGLAMQLPPYTEGWLLPRSSTFKKTGLIQTNSIGMIDNAYCGDNDEWMAVMYATRDGVLELGERYLQFKVMPCMKEHPIEEVLTLGTPNRGGFGSTDTPEGK